MFAYFSSEILMTGESRHTVKRLFSISLTDSLLILSGEQRRGRGERKRGGQEERKRERRRRRREDKRKGDKRRGE